ncbi:GNAT family N-acetyltransferase [Aliivibrio fischeri]|uniref:GNAT family N-acetyltransferase n=1 Tax=Aliivibrio fischeri TaxID=668 RepID=UPI0007C4DFF7|nr:GNAT family N-acetyltransferase [Aliivibrio fischeri]MBP3140226.1 GNAT family N-acetyltransferase [Aliivibrio fischeri]MBP3154611.1 GNAT family N-acetyltransferase [Aliivibrio fischeri]MCE7575765.1 GNAT family N-acetyltransferase [Aliivibrio fischeri]
MDIEITTQPTQNDIDEIRSGLRQHNKPYLEGIFHTDLACYSYKSNGDKSGGLIGEIWGNWLIIKFFWVDKESSGNGIGSELLAKAESYAIEHGCHSSFLDTFSFQAKPFYEKHGYNVEMVLKNHPITSERYYLTKSLLGCS